MIHEIRNYHYEPTLMAEYRDWATKLALPYIRRHLDVVGFWVNLDEAPQITGSPLDEPAKVLKAGVHGVPGGENMLRKPDGSIRYFTVRESARLQTFPDGYLFHGSWTETMRQLGNAVPVTLAETVALGIRKQLEDAFDARATIQSSGQEAPGRKHSQRATPADGGAAAAA